MSQYKKTYSEEKIQEIVEWFKARLDQLPPTLELHPSTKIRNLDYTVRTYIEIAETHHTNGTYGAQVFHLFKMREKLIELGIFS
jgi:hypothetical protein